MRRPDQAGADPAIVACHRLVHPAVATSSRCCVAVCTAGRADALTRLLDSLARQSMPPAALLVVDASRDDASERMLRARPDLARLAPRVEYVRVAAGGRGLTRQRNLALARAAQPLTAFLDDDVVLHEHALARLERALADDPSLVGACAVIENEQTVPSRLWRMRRALGIVPHLRPGRYTRTGMSVPWHFAPPVAGRLLEGDWLQGGAMIWRTEPARRMGFNEAFAGYATAEDLEFSLRMRAHGRLARVDDARVWHRHGAGGRPDAFRSGVMSTRNLRHVHRTCVPERSWRDALRFGYAFTADAALRAAAALLLAGERGARWRFAIGRVAALVGLAGGPTPRTPRTPRTAREAR